jgi:hypothetical protein
MLTACCDHTRDPVTTVEAEQQAIAAAQDTVRLVGVLFWNDTTRDRKAMLVLRCVVDGELAGGSFQY